ncbi:MAG: sulfotransferase [Zetaproteobacteria bacterium CG_4_9_14_3_um_filter_53_7]|nr:MAG: sulfotransferase [Zetaproteobacteria bacterium CG_4_9_14_3_um_filter_53_7]
MSEGIFWLASYPKSGNTWTRAFIANLRHEEPNEEVDINTLHTGAIASCRGWIDEVLGFDSADLSHDEIDLLRPAIYRWHAREANDGGYHKVHDAYTYLPNGEALIPAEATAGALYIMRNPLDVAISFAHHSNCSIDQSIENMGTPDFTFCGNTRRMTNQLRQKLLSWSAHVESWADASEINRLVVRYEDMRNDSLATFTRMCSFLGLPDDEYSVQIALDNCAFDKLQQQEKEKGFSEKAPHHESFFRKGKVGDWQETLTPEQIDRIVNDHHTVMKRFGYLDGSGNPVTALPLDRVS